MTGIRRHTTPSRRPRATTDNTCTSNSNSSSSRIGQITRANTRTSSQMSIVSRWSFSLLSMKAAARSSSFSLFVLCPCRSLFHVTRFARFVICNLLPALKFQEQVLMKRQWGWGCWGRGNNKIEPNWNLI